MCDSKEFSNIFYNIYRTKGKTQHTVRLVHQVDDWLALEINHKQQDLMTQML